jgi:hypothetical protein
MDQRVLKEMVNATEEETKRGGEPEPEFLWRQYSLWLDFYKFHMDLLLKANTFFYLITGGILTFYLSHPEQRMLRLSLCLPVLIGSALAATAIYGATLVGLQRREVLRLGKLLNCGPPPNVNGLRVLLWATAIILLVASAALLALATGWLDPVWLK